MSVYDNIYKLVNRIGSTQEIYKKDVSQIIDNIIFNKFDIDVGGCKMITGDINDTIKVYVVYSDVMKTKKKQVILDRILTLNENEQSYLLLIRYDILDLDIKSKTETLQKIYTELLNIVSTTGGVVDDVFVNASSIIMTLISLNGMYKDDNEFKSYINLKEDFKQKYFIDTLIKDVYNTLDLNACYPVTDNYLIDRLINNYGLYKFSKTRNDEI